jgi:hypothetical protein
MALRAPTATRSQCVARSHRRVFAAKPVISTRISALASERWWHQFGSSLRKIASRPRLVARALCSSGDGRKDIIEMEQLFGRALGLLRHNGRYGDLLTRNRTGVLEEAPALLARALG